MPHLRKDLSADALVSNLRSSFSRIADTRKFSSISLTDILMSAYAIFSLKYPSLLSFEDDNRMGEPETSNMATLYGIKQIPCDTHMREVIDEVPPDAFRPIFIDLFSRIQRGNILKDFRYLDGRYLMSIDGTGLFHSNEVHCLSCMEKQSRDGEKSFYHQMLSAVLVHPDMKEVIPFCPEPIQKQDGQSKNDCERNAAKRLLSKLREDHPKLDVIIVEDGLSSNAPHIRELIARRFSFILGAKPSDHKYLFEQASLAGSSGRSHQIIDSNGIEHRFNFVNSLSLNETNEDLKINFLEYEQFDPKGNKRIKWSWVTDIEITVENVYQIMRGGRARWRIESAPQVHTEGGLCHELKLCV
jgi:hypothetical protein